MTYDEPRSENEESGKGRATETGRILKLRCTGYFGADIGQGKELSQCYGDGRHDIRFNKGNIANQGCNFGNRQFFGRRGRSTKQKQAGANSEPGISHLGQQLLTEGCSLIYGTR